MWIRRSAFLSVALLPGVMLLAAAAPAAEAPQVTDAWVRLPAASGRPAGGYFTAKGGADDVLASVSSPQAERIEMHEMAMEGGAMRMRPLPKAGFAANGELRFAPGGSHLMLFGVADDVKPGDRLPLVFRFASGAEVTVQAEARAAAAAAPSAGMSHPDMAHH